MNRFIEFATESAIDILAIGSFIGVVAIYAAILTGTA